MGVGEQAAPQELGSSCSGPAGTGQPGEGGLLPACVAVVRLGVSWCSKAKTSAHPSAAFTTGEIFILSAGCSMGLTWFSGGLWGFLRQHVCAGLLCLMSLIEEM